MTGDVITAIGKQWHDACFVCDVGSFFFFFFCFSRTRHRQTLKLLKSNLIRRVAIIHFLMECSFSKNEDRSVKLVTRIKCDKLFELGVSCSQEFIVTELMSD